MFMYYDDSYDRLKRAEEEYKVECAKARLRSQGFVYRGYGLWDDPKNPTRTGAHIDSHGNIHRDM